MYSVYQHWDPLRVCVVGRSYPPEFYSWIKIPRVRSLFEKIAIETEEDYQHIIKKLKKFGVEILRPDLPKESFVNAQYVPPPMTPRDMMCMIGDTFYSPMGFNFQMFYDNVKDESWPECNSLNEFYKLSDKIKKECIEQHNLNFYLSQEITDYKNIFEHVEKQGNKIKMGFSWGSGAMVSRIGKDLYFATPDYDKSWLSHQGFLNKEFKNTRNHIIITGGHGDGTYCPVCPGLIISLKDVPNYADTFPGWEVVYLPNQSWEKVKPFLDLKSKNKGKWWIPGWEYDRDVVDLIENWLGHWTGYVEETVFDVNMLIIDPKNVMVFNYNKQVFDALDRHGITPHIVPFRHRYFWDGGIHCVTLDLDRTGKMQDFFPARSNQG